MARTVQLIAELALVGLLAAGCQSLTGKTAGRHVDDASIAAAVKSKLVADQFANLTRTDVDVENGTVYLSGAVETDQQRERAEQLAWQASGVQDVVNNLQIEGGDARNRSS